MKIKLNITNFPSFERALSECTEPVFTLDKERGKRKITSFILNQMKQQYVEQKYALSITCLCSPTSDYFHLLAATVWE